MAICDRDKIEKIYHVSVKYGNSVTLVMAKKEGDEIGS